MSQHPVGIQIFAYLVVWLGVLFGTMFWSWLLSWMLGFFPWLLVHIVALHVAIQLVQVAKGTRK